MNKKTIYWTGGITALIIVLLIFWAALGRNRDIQPDAASEGRDTKENLSGYMEEQNTIMDKMMKDMEKLEPEGSASTDFLKGMIPHHQAAVSMSESYLKYGGNDEELKTLAKDIIKAQNEEIEQMQSLIEEIKNEGSKNLEQEQSYLEAYNKMMSSHHSSHSSHSSSGNVEAAFAEGMMMHHQMAVEMAQAVVENTDNEQTKALAENIIETQQTEIIQMQDILKRITKSSDSHH